MRNNRTDSVRMMRRYLTGLPAFLGRTIAREDWRALVTRRIDERVESFRRVLDRGVFARPQNPYGRLMKHAGLDMQAVDALLRDRGIEGTLAELYDAGVYLSHAEFKGHEPVKRGSLAFDIGPRDLDNPYSSDAFTGRTGGSRSPGQRITVDLDMLALEAPHHGLMLEAFGFAGRDVALWRDVPPAAAGIKDLLRFAKIAHVPKAWFTPYRWSPRASLPHYGMTAYGLVVGRAVRSPLPVPRFTPLSSAVDVARWLARRAEQGRPAVLDTTPSAAVRVCAAANAAGIAIDGSMFVLAGEPFTSGRAAILRQSGTFGVSRYAMTEVGIIGMPCAAAAEFDDVHIELDKLAVLQRDTRVGDGRSVGEIHLTTLHPASPKILVNAGSGDYGELDERACGCPLHDLGMHVTLCRIRSYEKLTSEGMTFEAQQIMWILDELLPARFGGRPTDYQFVEVEQNGLTRLMLIASERIGALDEEAVADSVLDALGEGDRAKQLGAGTWRQGRTLQVARREPYMTSALKILPLHVLKDGQ